MMDTRAEGGQHIRKVGRCRSLYPCFRSLRIKSYFGSGAINGKMLLVRIIENNKNFRSV